MSEKKEQKIIVHLSFNEQDKNLILNGITLAGMFSKELCLLYNFSKKERKQVTYLQKKLEELSAPIKKEYPGLAVSTLLLSERKRNLPDVLSDKIEGIIVVASAGDFSRRSASLAESPIPYLFVPTQTESISAYKRIVLPIDLRTENSDSALWSTYFGRFNRSEIVVVAANDKSSDGKKQVDKNVFLTKKLYQKFSIAHKVYKGTRSSLGNAFEAQKLALNSNSDLLIILGSSTITPLDHLLGLPEKKIIRTSGKIPVLVVNPRKDNYVLCD